MARRQSPKSKSAKTGRSGQSTPRAQAPTVNELMARRRHRQRAIFALVALVIAALVLADCQGWLLYRGDAMARYDGQTFRVSRVIDGDTIVLAAPDGDEPVTRVRLWGIDTPELGRGGESDEPGAVAAETFAREQVLDKRVRLELEPHRVRGSYQRILAFVYLPDGTMLNESLLTEGLARADDRWSHRHMDRFELLQAQAERDGRGIWADEP